MAWILRSNVTPLVSGTVLLGAIGWNAHKPSIKADEAIHPPHFAWPHHGAFSGYDHASLRRGYQIYKEVCSQCHGLDRIAFRNLIGATHTEKEAKDIATSYNITDGPDDRGKPFERPGKLSDYFPNPYANENEARAANNKAYPPDLSLITKARHGGEDYIFALLTGYKDPPAGVELRDGLHYNPYFPGCAIAMPQQLYDDMIEYDDGTPATVSQMAKDVTSFLSWAAEPELEERKLMGFRAFLLLGGMLVFFYYMKRYRWNVLKTRRVVFDPKK